MKKKGMISLLLSCLLLSGCSSPPSSRPPEYSLVSSAEIQLKNGQIAQSDTVTYYYGEKTSEYYRCFLKNGIEYTTTEENFNISLGKLTYKQFSVMLQDVVKQLNTDRLGLTECPLGEPEIQYDATKNITGAEIAANEADEEGPFRYRGYYVYSLQERTLVKGDHVMVGRDDFGKLRVSDHSFHIFSEDHLEILYILIAD